jgi:4-amino-4-deoxy-L-arabinose transferase-like glycosyltransferase
MTAPILPATTSPGEITAAASRFWREWEFWAATLIVAVIYFGRLTAVPICGEESRWAGAAREMIASGDWIVPRQQGQVFAERPPLGSWAMALVGLVVGQVGALAVRLPSALATTGLAAVIYAYGRLLLARPGALAAALAYATMGQVLQIGRLGESEAVFSFLLASALFAWHAGYLRHWPRWLAWSAGYGLTSLAALDKGPQALVYFVAVTCGLLVWLRDWRWLVCWGHAFGAALLVFVIALWQIPFWLATDSQTVVDVWSGLARDRFSFAGLLGHMAKYPLETFGCLLPWSPMLIGYLDPRFRRGLGSYRAGLTFLVAALAITYPSVWLSAGARGRYFMPLYPCLALLIGIAIERSTAIDAARELRRGWRWYLAAIGITAAAIGAVVLVASAGDLPRLAALRQPVGVAAAFAVAMAAIAVTLTGCLRSAAPRPRLAVLTIATLLGTVYTGLLLNIKARDVNDLTPDVAALKAELPHADKLVSFGPVAHRFAYFYGEPIRELPWPTDAAALPAGCEYFCFEQHRGDNQRVRFNGRGRTWNTTPGSLPFEWQQVAWVPCDPNQRVNPTISVVVGRIVAKPSAAGLESGRLGATRAARSQPANR